jgi:RimJ/RimL family protein N-acetyltransferase
MTDTKTLISTPRLYLSQFDPDNVSHCTFLVELYNSPLFIASEGKTNTTTLEKAKEAIENRILGDYKRNGYGTYLISLKPTPTTSLAESQPIGTVSLSKGDSQESYPTPDIGYAILPEMNGKGYATEASIYLIRYAKEKFGVHDVFGFCKPGNKHSGRVMQKASLEYRGTTNLACFGGARADVYALPHMDDDLTVYGIKNWNEQTTSSA